MLEKLKLKLIRVSIRLLMAQRIRSRIREILGEQALDWISRIRYSEWMQRREYHAWIKSFEARTLDLACRTQQSTLIDPGEVCMGSCTPTGSAGMPIKLNACQINSKEMNESEGPRLSVLLRGCGNFLPAIERTLASIKGQHCVRWELFLLTEVPVAADVLTGLQHHAKLDVRIHAEPILAQPPGSETFANWLQDISSDYVALIDSGGELSSHAMSCVAQAIKQHPDASLLYGDEDSVSPSAGRSRPVFKPDWDPELFYATPYLGDLCIFRRDLFSEIAQKMHAGGEQLATDACVLRSLPRLQRNRVVHIPHILYHRRLPDRRDAGVAAIGCTADRAALLRDNFAGLHASVNISRVDSDGTYRVQYSVPTPEPLVSILIPTRDRLDLLVPCVRGILERTGYGNFEVLILDNQSTRQDTLDYFFEITAADSRVKVLHYSHPFNYSAIINYGAEHARGALLLLLNNDVDVINSDWLGEMVSQALRPEIGCVGAKLYYEDDTIQHAGVVIGLGGIAGHAHRFFPRAAGGQMNRLRCVQSFLAVTAACLMVRKEVFHAVGGFNDEELKVAFNDVDFCLKVRELGLRNLWTPYAELYHYESKSRGVDDTPEKRARFLSEAGYMKKRWGTDCFRDPYYNPNLTLDYEDFSINLRERG